MLPKLTKTTIFLLLAFFVTSSVYSQTINSNPGDGDESPAKSYFKGSLDYLSNRVYNGRADTVTVPYITPTLSYYNKTGLNASAGVSYNPNSGLLDLVTLNAGYEFDIVKDKLSANIDGDAYFYNANSTSIRAGSVGDAEASLVYNNDVVSVTAGVSWEFYKTNTNAIYTNFALSHEFTFDEGKDGSVWSITPTAATNAGNQQFLYTYRTQKQKVVLKKGKDTTETKTSVTTTGNLKFQLLDYEFSLPVGYEANNWGFLFTPTYAIPVNPITSTTTSTKTNKKTDKETTTTSVQTEVLKDRFYVELMFYIKF